MSNPRQSRVYSSPSLPTVQGRIDDFQSPPDTGQIPAIQVEYRSTLNNIFPLEVNLSDFLYEYAELVKKIDQIGPILAKHILDEYNFINSNNPAPLGIGVRRIEVKQKVFELVRTLYPFTTNINTSNWQSEDIDKLNYIIKYANNLIAFYQEYLNKSE